LPSWAFQFRRFLGGGCFWPAQELLRHRHGVIATRVGYINELDRSRTAAGLSKAALARATGTEPAVIRRLFTAPGANPTRSTLAGVAAALGLQVTLEPLPAPERELITAALQSGQATVATAKVATQLRTARPRPVLPR